MNDTLQRERIDRLEAFTQAMIGIFPELDAEHQHIYKTAPNRIVGRIVMSSEDMVDRISNLERSLIKSANHAKEMESNWRGARIENTLNLARIEALEREIEASESTIYDLQMADPHLEFISRVQDAGMHHAWDNFMLELTELERDIIPKPTKIKTYDIFYKGFSDQLDYEFVESSEYAILCRGKQISMDEIVMRLNRLSEREKQNDDISKLVLEWTEHIADLLPSQDYDRGYIRGIESCRDSVSEVWHE